MGRKFTDEDLKLFLNQGLSQVEIARKVGVSEQAVSYRVKRLKAKQESQDQDLSTILDYSNYQGNPSIKNQLNEKELKFLELYLSGEYTIEKAMIAAGYANYHPKYIHVAARKIIEKYEQQAGDHRKIMRAMGYGETKAIEMLIDSATNAKSEMVRLNARAILAKCLGLHQDVVAANLGIQIVIKGREDHTGRPAAQVRQEASRVPPRTMAITR